MSGLLARVRPDLLPRCSGSMSDEHDGEDVESVRLSRTTVTYLCRGCRNAAGRLGMIERRAEPRPEPRDERPAWRRRDLARDLTGALR